MSTQLHDKISPTALFVAFLRTFSDIPFSSEIALACNAKKVATQFFGGLLDKTLWVAPIIEQRYKSVDALLQQCGYSQILELAAGVSPRGLIWGQASGMRYLMTDLAEMIADNRRILGSILSDRAGTNLSWLPLNVVNAEDFDSTETILGNGPVAVVSEGLLPYLDLTEKGRVVKNVHRFLSRHGGIWITPDVTSAERMRAILQMDPETSGLLGMISGPTGRNMAEYAWPSFDAAQECFEGAGFKVTRHLQHELVPSIVSTSQVPCDPDRVQSILSRQQVWMMQA